MRAAALSDDAAEPPWCLRADHGDIGRLWRAAFAKDAAEPLVGIEEDEVAGAGPLERLGTGLRRSRREVRGGAGWYARISRFTSAGCTISARAPRKFWMTGPLKTRPSAAPARCSRPPGFPRRDRGPGAPAPGSQRRCRSCLRASSGQFEGAGSSAGSPGLSGRAPAARRSRERKRRAALPGKVVGACGRSTARASRVDSDVGGLSIGRGKPEFWKPGVPRRSEASRSPASLTVEK
jgi:hypothetical protein